MKDVAGIEAADENTCFNIHIRVQVQILATLLSIQLAANAPERQLMMV